MLQALVSHSQDFEAAAEKSAKSRAENSTFCPAQTQKRLQDLIKQGPAGVLLVGPARFERGSASPGRQLPAGGCAFSGEAPQGALLLPPPNQGWNGVT